MNVCCMFDNASESVNITRSGDEAAAAIYKYVSPLYLYTNFCTEIKFFYFFVEIFNLHLKGSSRKI